MIAIESLYKADVEDTVLHCEHNIGKNPQNNRKVKDIKKKIVSFEIEDVNGDNDDNDEDEEEVEKRLSSDEDNEEEEVEKDGENISEFDSNV